MDVQLSSDVTSSDSFRVDRPLAGAHGVVEVIEARDGSLVAPVTRTRATFWRSLADLESHRDDRRCSRL